MTNPSNPIIDGPAGALEVLFTKPDGAPTALALICHPHPQFGGTMDNKVVQTLAKAFVELHFATVRFNFRGVGRSAGAFDDGIGETEDAAVVLDWARRQLPESTTLVAAGFSFGCFVQSRLLPRAKPNQLVLVAPAVSRFQIPDVPKGTIVIHGEEDDVVPLSEVLNWARPQGIPVTVFPGAGHFFHGRLTELKAVVKRNCQPDSWQ
jgi:uncharacterized protein